MRLLKRIAEFAQVDINGDTIQYLTDSMANNLLIKMEYENSGWRTVQPYGWNNSKDNNLLVMCYKADSSVRSYRLDRILQLFVDDSLLQAETGVEFEESTDKPQNSPEDYVIPYLPETDDILEMSEKEDGEEEPFNDAVQTLEQSINDTTDYVSEHEKELVDNINDKHEEEMNDNSNNEQKEELNENNSQNNTDFDLDNESGKNDEEKNK